MSKKTPVLCFASKGHAYFTTQPLHLQWGDDWDDAPMREACPPYYPSREENWWLIEVAYEGDFVGPEEVESPLSVKELNAKVAPWLHHLRTGTQIYAGCTLEEFFELMQRCGASCRPISGKYECPHTDYWQLRQALAKALREHRNENIVAQDPCHWTHEAQALLAREV